MKENSILIFLTAPLPDKISPALTAAFGPERAVDVYIEMARSVFASAKKIAGAGVVLAYSADSRFQDLRWLDHEDPGFLAVRGDIDAEHFINSVSWTFCAGARRVVVVSPMSPGIPAEWLEKAFLTLHEKNMVLGPVQDGDYYLLGLNDANAEIFADYPWSGKRFSDELADRAKHARRSLFTMPEFFAVRDEKSYQQWKNMTRKVKKGDEKDLFNFMAEPPAEEPKKES